MKKVYILLANGFETIEALAPKDVFFRCGIDVKLISINSELYVTSSHKVTIKADALLKDIDAKDADVLYLPGGYPGYVNLRNSTEVGELAQYYYMNGKILALICGAPTILPKNNIARGSKITCHHSVKNDIIEYNYSGKQIEIDKNLYTARGAGLSVEFAIEIARSLVDQNVIEKVLHGLELK